MKGFGLLETIVALGIFSIITTVGIVGFIPSLQLGRTGREQTQASALAQEGIEAVRSIRDQNFSSLTSGSFGIGLSNNSWSFSGQSDVTDKFSRQIIISPINRDSGGSLVNTGGTVDPDSYSVVSNISWNNSVGDTRSLSVDTILTNWRKNISTGSTGGIIVYGDGQQSTDSIKYRLFDGTNWTVPASLADVDPATTNKYLRAVRVYSSPTRDEKIVISRHYDGTRQYVYSQVFNGTTWGNVSIGSSWTANTFLDVQNFDGTYLANGDFMMVYSDNTIIPKFKIWNGSSWSSGQPMVTLLTSGVPNFIVAKARPNTNEVMVAFFDQASDTTTEYFNGGSYLTSNWTKHPVHATAAPLNTKKIIDFSWQPSNSLKGVLVYSETSTDKSINMKIFLANGSGSGSWGNTVNSPNQNGQNLGSLDVEIRPYADEAISCDKDAKASPSIYCFEANIATTSPVWTTPINNTIAASTQNGIQQTFHFGFENSGSNLLTVYSDNTITPKYKLYDPLTNTFDLNASSISNLSSILNSVRLIPSQRSKDIMVLMGDAGPDCYSIIWDGNGRQFYTTTGKNLVSQGLNGSASTDYWFDFVWN